MTREEIHCEMEETLGAVPHGAREMPDEFLEEEWSLWKRLRISDTAIPQKEKAMISLGIAAANHDRVSCLMYTEIAKAHGATEEQLREVAYLAKAGAGMVPYACANLLTKEEGIETIHKISSHCKEEAHRRAA